MDSTLWQGAEEMHEMELTLNLYASKVAKGYCAHFLGHCTVTDDDATTSLTPGLWLAWKYEGSRTLSYYLRRRDTMRSLAQELDIPEEAVLATVMKQLLKGLAAFHSAGLVHRDIKPLNLIFAEEDQRFKLIDLGACADLRTGTNFAPDESILDPMYAPPEKYVLPTESPSLSSNLFLQAISPMLWAMHKPDRFDIWSAGIVMLQLAVPTLRNDHALKKFNAVYSSKYMFDLDAWRKDSMISRREFELLDADDGAGWSLLKSMLWKRNIQVDDKGHVSFTDSNSLQRVSAEEALKSRFMRQAVQPGLLSIINSDEAPVHTKLSARTTYGSGSSRSVVPAAVSSRSQTGSTKSYSGSNRPSFGRSSDPDPYASAAAAAQAASKKVAASKTGAFGMAVNLWREVTGKLFDLEAQIMTQSSATEKQTEKVKLMRKQASSGRVPVNQVAAEEQILGGMEAKLKGLKHDFQATAKTARGLFSFLGFGGREEVAEKEPLSHAELYGKASHNVGSTKSKLHGVDGAEVSVWQKLAGKFLEVDDMFNTPKVSGESQSMTGKRQQGSQKTSDHEEVLNSDYTSDRLDRMEQLLEILAREKEQQQMTDVRVSEQHLDALSMRRERKLEGRLTQHDLHEMSEDDLQRMLDARSSRHHLESRIPQRHDLSDGDEEEQSRDWRDSEHDLGTLSMKKNTRSSSYDDGLMSSPGDVDRHQSRLMMGGSQLTRSTREDGKESEKSGTRGSTLWSVFGKGNKTSTHVRSDKNAAAYGQARTGTGSSSGTTQGTGSTFTSAQVGEGLRAGGIMLGGIAARLAMGMASSLKEDAEKMMKNIEAAERAKALQRAQEAAFIAFLKDKRSSIHAHTTYEQLREAAGTDLRFTQMDEQKGRTELKQFVDIIVEEELKAQQKARLDKLKTELNDVVQPEDSNGLKESGVRSKALYEGDMVSTLHSAVSDGLHLKDRGDVEGMTVEELAASEDQFRRLQAQREREEAVTALVEVAESSFMNMLATLTPTVTQDSLWPLVKPLIAGDARYRAVVPEYRRQQLFQKFVIGLEEREVAGVLELNAPTVTRSLPLEMDGDIMTMEDIDEAEVARINSLRDEQVQLRSEYEKMEAKLQEMERMMKDQELVREG
ncbi:hypothetical protein CEUSTIGMA_g7365.t1 [Chlamydomonas eustigma]|uniref:Protein kinase domain-containing protein n=1 Tax=Chlamydomonas eustigma TaxID=1157962 RepID=A0A250X9Z6_9CHLO|nr:hypothetical protein CEUSTIGMA_g7365.t1 [Chlamydomonas eustigma]|eukprot:GAX79925.1 hypothetical protein CEUSTIGMA_g7365.t1 [Chlamydomonas eustigma]